MRELGGTDHLLHVLAYISLRALTPTKAHALMMRFGEFFTPLPSVNSARVAAKRLRGGSCLSRALTIAARTPGSEVVIGVQQPDEFGAHAWVELGGVPLDANDPRGEVIIRLRR